jgi:hypothetical protein
LRELISNASDVRYNSAHKLVLVLESHTSPALPLLIPCAISSGSSIGSYNSAAARSRSENKVTVDSATDFLFRQSQPNPFASATVDFHGSPSQRDQRD